jgi:pimeloyl-ACP methyl ester carboxylesterase
VGFICDHHGVPKISIIAHSWGTIATGRFAGRCPDLVERLVFFGPVTWRQKKAEPQTFPAWRVVSLKDQWDRFIAEVPPGEPGVLSKSHFEEWGSLYLDTDPESRSRSPASVKTPSGPWQDIAASGAGDLAYDPGLIRAPVAIVRGEWDSLATDADAGWLFDALKASPMKRDVRSDAPPTSCTSKKTATRFTARRRPFWTIATANLRFASPTRHQPKE